MNLSPIQLLIIQLIVIPALQPFVNYFEKKAKGTPDLSDDALVGVFKAVLEVLKNPDTFIEKETR